MPATKAMARDVERSERHTRLDARWPHTRPVQMPRQARPLFVGDPGFWPRDGEWSLCRYLIAFNVTLWAVLIFSIVNR